MSNIDIASAANCNAVRVMTDNDIAAVMRIQAECYPPLMLESEAVFRDRLAQTPATCWVWSPHGQDPAAYLFSYPSNKDVVTALDQAFKLAAAPDCLYLHDLAVTPAARGRRAANALVAVALERARADGLHWSALVSVQQSQAFWSALGYASIEVRHSPAKENLASYQVSENQATAVYMCRQLS